ncbi:hypothetical protein CF139_03885 [Aeromonas hydrophila]|nr:hypothetical protein CF139_03885 [Aeromonas hydrophila]
MQSLGRNWLTTANKLFCQLTDRLLAKQTFLLQHGLFCSRERIQQYGLPFTLAPPLQITIAATTRRRKQAGNKGRKITTEYCKALLIIFECFFVNRKIRYYSLHKETSYPKTR